MPDAHDIETLSIQVLAAHRWGGYIGPNTDRYPLGRYARCAGCDWTATHDPDNLFAAHEAHVASELAARIEQTRAGESALRETVTEALAAPGVTPDGEPLPEWVHVDELRVLAGMSPQPQNEDRCACGALALSTTVSESHDRGLHGRTNCIGALTRDYPRDHRDDATEGDGDE